jgi:hypothetical protein
MHRILALGLRISKYCWEDLTHYSRCRYYPYQEGQKRSWSAVGGCRGMSRERSKCTIQVGKRQRSVQQHTTSLTVLFTSNSSGAAMFMSTTSWRTDLVRFIVLVVLLRWTSARNTVVVASCKLKLYDFLEPRLCLTPKLEYNNWHHVTASKNPKNNRDK